MRTQRLVALAALLLGSPALAQSTAPATAPSAGPGIRAAARQRRSVSLGFTGAGPNTGVPHEESGHIRRATGGSVPDTYSVRPGDTLWDICGFFFDNPYEWPRIWSYNPQITNPHWIFPGDAVNLRREHEAPPTLLPEPTKGPRLRTVRRTAVPDTVFLRDVGFVDREELVASGTIVGAPEDRMMLSTLDDVYVQFHPGANVPVGTEFTVYTVDQTVNHPHRDEEVGSLVRFLGTVRIGTYDARRAMARATITEAVDPIERGQLVGLIGRRFNVVPPARNDRNLVATVIATLVPMRVIGEHHIVFVDVGGQDGVQPGNRLYVVRRGDPWRQSRLEEDPNAADYPEEHIAELRVVDIRRHTATCLVIRSLVDVRVGDYAAMYREVQ